MDPRQIYLVRNSLDWFSPCGPALIARVVQRVRERDPHAASVLGPGGETQNKQLFATLRQIVRGMSNFHKLEPALLQAGGDIAVRGGHAALYAIARDELIDTMAELAGDDWSQDLTDSWREVLNTVSGVLLRSTFNTRAA